MIYNRITKHVRIKGPPWPILECKDFVLSDFLYAVRTLYTVNIQASVKYIFAVFFVVVFVQGSIILTQQEKSPLWIQSPEETSRV